MFFTFENSTGCTGGWFSDLGKAIEYARKEGWENIYDTSMELIWSEEWQLK